MQAFIAKKMQIIFKHILHNEAARKIEFLLI